MPNTFLLWEGHYNTIVGFVVCKFARNSLFILTLTKRLNELIFSSRGLIFPCKMRDKMKSFVHAFSSLKSNVNTELRCNHAVMCCPLVCLPMKILRPLLQAIF